MSQSSCFKSRLDPKALGGGGLKYWNTLRMDGLGGKMVAKISTSPR